MELTVNFTEMIVIIQLTSIHGSQWTRGRDPLLFTGRSVWRQLSHHQGSKDDSSHHQGPKDDRPVYTEPITPRTLACHASPSPSEPPWTHNTHLLDTMLFVNRCSTYEHKTYCILYTLTPIYSYGFSPSTSFTWSLAFTASPPVWGQQWYIHMVSLRPLPLHDYWPFQRLLLCGVSTHNHEI